MYLLLYLRGLLDCNNARHRYTSNAHNSLCPCSRGKLDRVAVPSILGVLFTAVFAVYPGIGAARAQTLGIASVTINSPNPVYGGYSTTGTVYLTGPGVQGMYIQLTTSNGAAILDYSNLPISNGVTSVDFVIHGDISVATPTN